MSSCCTPGPTSRMRRSPSRCGSRSAPGVAVGITGGPSGYRTQRILIFDPTTYELLGEEERVVEPTEDGIPAGSIVRPTTYLASRVVDRLP